MLVLFLLTLFVVSSCSIFEGIFWANETKYLDSEFGNYCRERVNEETQLVFVQKLGSDRYVSLPDWEKCEKLRHLKIVIQNLFANPILPPNAFAGLYKLRSLSLKRNRFESLPENVFKNLSNLENLNLERNELTDLTDLYLSGLAGLTHLAAANNRIMELTPNTFYELDKLRHLDLSFNRIEVISEGTFENCRSLTKLDLSKNRIFSINSNQFQTNKKLRAVNLSNNRITNVNNNTFVNNTRLRQINLFKNNILSSNDEIFKGLQEIEEVNLGFNRLREFPIYSEFPKDLKLLDLNGNPLECGMTRAFLTKAANTTVLGYCLDARGRRHILSDRMG